MGSGYRTEFKNQFNGQARLSQDFGKWVPGLKANVAFSFDAYTKNITKRTKKNLTIWPLGVMMPVIWN